jgi:CubicO group peptidase (beta-lactamase class C family)
MMLNKGTLDGKRVLSEKAVAEMTKVQTGDIKTGFVRRDGVRVRVGGGARAEGRHRGAARPAASGTAGRSARRAWIDPAQDLFVVLLIQRTGLPNADASPMRAKLRSWRSARQR